MQMRVVSSFSSGLEVMLTRLVDENRSSFKYEARMMFVIELYSAFSTCFFQFEVGKSKTTFDWTRCLPSYYG